MQKDLKRPYFLFWMALAHLGGEAQITGSILDESNHPLEYATAALFQENDSTLVAGVVTDIAGAFTLTGIPNGDYYLEASFIGYQPLVIGGITLDDQRRAYDVGVLRLVLGNLLDEVVVAGEKATVINKIDRQIFEADRFKSALGGTATDVLRNLPSVSIDALGEIRVRGSGGFAVLLNGRPLQGNVTNVIAQLPANAIERVEVITAPSARYDPEGKAGIINILTNKDAADVGFGQVNLKAGLPSTETYGNAEAHPRYGLDGTYNIRKDRWNLSFGASYLRNDLGGRREGDVYTIIEDTLTRFPSTGERSFDEVNYSGRFTVDYVPNDRRTFSLGFYTGKRSKDRLADIIYTDNHAITPAQGGERLYTLQYFNHNLRERKGDFILGNFDYGQTFANESRLSLSLLYEYTLLGGPTVNQNLGYPNTETLYQDEYNTNDNPLHGTRLQLDYVWKPTSWGTLETGYQFRSLVHTGDFIYERRTDFAQPFVLVPEFSSEADLKRSIHSVYVQLAGEKRRWEYNAGARVEVMDRDFDLRDKAGLVDTTYTYNFVKLYPAATLQYNLSDNTRIKASYSKRVERTTTFKMNPFPEREHSETLEQGDPTLRPEFIDLWEVGLSKNFKGGHSFYATAYASRTKNLVNRVNTVYNDSILNRIYSNVGTARAYGIEMGLQANPAKSWSNFIGGNLYRYHIEGVFDNRSVDTHATVYSVNANSTYRFWKNASLQLTFNYLSRRNTAQGVDSRFYSPNLSFQKSFWKDRLTTTLQWQQIDMGLLRTNEQRITTFRPDAFYTTTNYIYEVDMIFLNLTYVFRKGSDKSKFIDSEFGKREF